MQSTDKNRILEYIKQVLTEYRLKHTLGVACEAVSLAKRYGEDPDKAEFAALAHDMVRDCSQKELDRYLNDFHLDPGLAGNRSLSHGKIAGALIERDFQINDEDIINAVTYHTTGRPGMSKLEKILYLADAIEPGRKYPGVLALRKKAFIDLDSACFECMKRTVEYVKEKGLCLDRNTILAINEFERERREYEK